jgi:hypothetical protein
VHGAAAPPAARCSEHSASVPTATVPLIDLTKEDIISAYQHCIFAATMMVAISLKLPDELVQTSGECARALHLSRAEYMRRAIERMNRETQAQLRAKRLAEVSHRVRDESMRVNAEFAAVEQDPDAE